MSNTRFYAISRWHNNGDIVKHISLHDTKEKAARYAREMEFKYQDQHFMNQYLELDSTNINDFWHKLGI